MTDTVISKKTVTIVDKAAKGITAATAAVTKVVAELNVLVSTSNDLAFDIESASGKLADIETNTKAALRDAQADLAIRVKEDAEKVLTTLLNAGKLARITTADFAELNKALQDAVAGNDAELGKAVGIATNKAESAAKLTASELKAANAVANAEKDAEVKALKLQVTFLEKSVTTLESNAEREVKARVDIAANTAQPVFNTNTAK